MLNYMNRWNTADCFYIQCLSNCLITIFLYYFRNNCKIFCFVLTFIRFWKIVLEPTFLLSYLNVLFYKYIWKVYIFGIFYGVFIEYTRLESPHRIEYSMVGAEPTGRGLSPSPSMLTPYSLTHKHNSMEGVWSGAQTEPKVHLYLLISSFNCFRPVLMAPFPPLQLSLDKVCSHATFFDHVIIFFPHQKHSWTCVSSPLHVFE